MGRSLGWKELKIRDFARSVVRSSRIARGLGSLNRFVDFLAVDRYFLRSREAEAYLVAADVDDRDDNIVVDDDALARFAG